jgi:hypothetical protein
MQRPNHLTPKKMLTQIRKVNLNLNLLVIEILNVFKCLGKGHIASQCPNRRVMLTTNNMEVKYESDKSESEEMPPLVDCVDDKIVYPVEGEGVIRRALNIQIKEDDVD